MRRRHALRAGVGLVAGGLLAIAGCAGIDTQATAPIKLNNDTNSQVFVHVDTENIDGDFSREVEIIIPDNGFRNDPWFKEMFVDEGRYQVRIMTRTETAETSLTHPSGDWDYLSVAVSPSAITTQTFEQ